MAGHRDKLGRNQSPHSWPLESHSVQASIRDPCVTLSTRFALSGSGGSVIALSTMLLALSPQSVHHPHYSSAHMVSNIMSLAIHPTGPMTHGRASAPALSGDAGPSPSKRPKLSLDTITAPTKLFGKSSTSLRLDTLSAASPTTRNTFRNAYNQNQSHRKHSSHSPQQPRSPRLKRNRSSLDAAPTSPVLFMSTNMDSDSGEPDITIPVSNVDALTLDPPYKLAFNLISILSNSPLARATMQKSSLQSASIPRVAKKVAFREPLTEEITTTTYTMRHSDIESISSVPIHEPSSHESTQISISTTEARSRQQLSLATQTTAGSPQSGSVQDSSSDDDSDTSPKTPVAGRKRRHHQWVWTLGPSDARPGSMDDQVGCKEEPMLAFEGEQGI